MAQTVKNLSAVQETQVQFLGWEDSLGKEVATHSQYSCLGNAMDGGAWRGTAHGMAKSQTCLSN